MPFHISSEKNLKPEDQGRVVKIQFLLLLFFLTKHLFTKFDQNFEQLLSPTVPLSRIFNKPRIKAEKLLTLV